MNWKYYLVLILVLLVIVLLAIDIITIKDNRTRCLSNPFVYAIQETNILNQDNFTCNCFSGKGFSFSVNKDGIKSPVIGG